MKRLAMWLTMALLLMAAVPEAHAQLDDPPGLGDVTGAISNVYGTFQAAEFLAALAGFNTGPQLQDAVNELEGYIQRDRDQAVINGVMGDIGLFQQIAADWQNGLTNGLEVEYVASVQNNLAQLEGDIQSGDMTDAYLLAPAFNLEIVTYVANLKAIGIEDPTKAYPDDFLNSFFDTAMAIDYPLVGAVWVRYDLMNKGGRPNMIGTQGGKTMWPKYAYLAGDFFEPQYDAVFSCDFTLPQNVDSDSFQTCFIDSDYQPFALSSYPVALQDATNILDTNRGQFQADPAVHAIGAAMNGLINIGHNVVTDWNTGSFGMGTGHVLISL